MLNVGSSIVAILFNFWGVNPAELPSIPVIAWQDTAIFQVPTEPDPQVEILIDQYLDRLGEKQIPRDRQGVWIQSEWAILGDRRSQTRVPAASLTKVATTLASLHHWGPSHVFQSEVLHTGFINDGVLQGDLVIHSGGDPLFVWEDAIALGKALQDLGIQTIAGDIVIVGPWYMNFEGEDPERAAEFLAQGLNQARWGPALRRQFAKLNPQPQAPEIELQGTVQLQAVLPPDTQQLLRLRSLPVAMILQQMNLYSNNNLSHILADGVGGAKQVEAIAESQANISPEQINLINGSGLGRENQMTPQAAVKLFQAIEIYLEDNGSELTVWDLFPVGGWDSIGTMQFRGIPNGTANKTGTLNRMSALAGVFPTEERGLVWFALQNDDGNILEFRAAQDWLLTQLAEHWSFEDAPGERVEPVFGDPNRIVWLQ
ncbi:MAG: D-alanyl-D-alanine carboxypeptidase [Cyanobacteria bacterium P01_H01_bin.15]